MTTAVPTSSSRQVREHGSQQPGTEAEHREHRTQAAAAPPPNHHCGQAKGPFAEDNPVRCLAGASRLDAPDAPGPGHAGCQLSRPQVRKLMNQGVLDFRMVGAHHRIGVASIQAFLDAERPRRRAALTDLARVQDELGLTE
ncbi:MAG: hypothetical protein ACRDNZ_02465 [Streptosporangiaceae bacterium]